MSRKLTKRIKNQISKLEKLTSKYEECLIDFHKFGTRFDTTPTMQMTNVDGKWFVPAEFVGTYATEMDKSVRDRAGHTLNKE